MKIKTKLFLSFGFLFVVIALLGGIGSYYLHVLAEDSRAIMQDNHRTLVYIQKMEHAVDALQQLLPQPPDVNNNSQIQHAAQQLKRNLNLQQQNVTEPGEAELTASLIQEALRLNQLLRQIPFTQAPTQFFLQEINPQIFKIEEELDHIYLLNEEAMLFKNRQANQTAERVVLYMSVFSIAAIVLGLLFLLSIPGYISRPIIRFNDAIGEVARGNYKHKIEVSTSDEFGKLAQSFNKMALRLREYQQGNYARILSEKTRLDAVISQMEEAIIGLNENKEIIFANNRALQLLELRKEQIVGKYAPDVAVSNQLMQNLIEELFIGFEPWEERRYKPLKIAEDNQEKLFSKSIVDITHQTPDEERKTLLGHVIILTDITEFAEKTKAKTHFMAVLSHELKTPVAAIEMSNTLLSNPKIGALNTEQSQLLRVISENTHRIQRIIREVLDLSKIESGKMDVWLVPVAPEDIIQRAVEGVHPFLADKSLKIQTQLSDPLPLVHADPDKLTWILNNFLTNAIRYAPPKSDVVLKAESEAAWMRIEVADQGPGISSSDQKRIFQRFTQLQPHTSGGTGLGLAISKEFVEAMGGQIGVFSQEGHGSTFWIKLPTSANYPSAPDN
ncbi:MAG: HAMP domain-containing protein [Bacteroidia bacterium]|nr:HAMP domain-containing protein [Bacteroidia bacterium]